MAIYQRSEKYIIRQLRQEKLAGCASYKTKMLSGPGWIFCSKFIAGARAEGRECGGRQPTHQRASFSGGAAASFSFF